MNKRIKELVEQARNYALDEKRIYERIYNTEQSMEEYRDVYNEKFAELIVRECMDIAVNRNTDNEAGYVSVCREHAAKQIAEHFGVEE